MGSPCFSLRCLCCCALAQLCPEAKYGTQWAFVKDSKAPDEPPKEAPLAKQRQPRMCGDKRPQNYSEDTCDEEVCEEDTPVAKQRQLRANRRAQMSSVQAEQDTHEEVQGHQGEDAVMESSGTQSPKNNEQGQTGTTEASSPAMAMVSRVSRLVTRLMSADNQPHA